MTMELGDREQQYYAELFQACDVEGSGRITGLKASELFCASGLNPEILKQITELCGAKRLGHFGRSQFYIALKLVALAQAGLPLKLDAVHPGSASEIFCLSVGADLCNNLNPGLERLGGIIPYMGRFVVAQHATQLKGSKEIPLPKFSSKGSEQADRKKSSGEPDGTGPESKPGPPMSGQLPPPPKKSHMRSLSGQCRATVPDGAATASPAIPVASGGSTHYIGQANAQEDPILNSKSPPLSPPTSPPAQKQLLKQHTAPPGSFANTLANAAPAGSSHAHPLVASSSIDHLDGPRHGTTDACSEGGNTHSVVMGNGAAGASETPATAPGPAHHHPSQVPTHQNPHGHENGNWAMFEDDESHMLIGAGVKQHYNSLEPPNFDSSSISSEAESVDDVWTITDEQREYYINQFKIMQPDLNNVITGPVAKQFFEKSKLPVIELSKIWNLSDLNHDGALSMEEFCIAMHLVVLRRNEIELPDRLPLSLMPYSSLANDEPFAADLPPGSTLKRATPPSPQNTAQWTAFVPDSPGSSGVSSPANLANFEFAKPSADPDLKIVQPVAMHVSPESLPLQNEGIDRGRAFSDSAVPVESRDNLEGELTPSVGKQRSNTESHALDPTSPTDTPNSKYNTPIQGRPRPIPPKKHNSVPAIVRGQLPPPGSAVDMVDSGGGPGPSHTPPTPPPRPPHGRSMSVDIKPAAGQLVAPAVPPRVSPKEAQSASKPGDPGPPASINEGTLQSSPSDLTSDTVHSVSVTAEKDLMEDEDMVDNTVKERLQPKPALALRQGSRDRRDIHMAVRTHKERNSMLTRLNSELNQELQEVMEQRIALEIQLEHLRPFSS